MGNVSHEIDVEYWYKGAWSRTVNTYDTFEEMKIRIETAPPYGLTIWFSDSL